MRKITIDPHNCSREEYQELIDYLEEKCWDYEQEPEAPEVNYMLKENGIHIFGSHFVELNTAKIQEDDLHEYGIVHRESLIDDLYRWIGEGNQQAGMMKDDLRMLEEWKDDYIFSSNSTNSYIGSGCSNFDETCKEFIKIQEEL